MKKKKLLVVVPSEVYGGGETYVKNLVMSHGIKEKFDIVLCSACEKLNQQVEVPLVYGLRGARSLSVATIINILKINKIIRLHNPTFVLLNGLPEIGVYSRYIQHDHLVCVAHSNEDWLTEPFFKGFLRTLKRLVIHGFERHLFKFIAINNNVLQNASRRDCLSKKSVLINTGVPKVKCSRRSKDGKIVFGRMSRLVEGKGNELLVSAFADLISKNSNVELIFAGEGEEKVKLEALVSRLNIESNVKFIGHVSQEEFYSSIDCMVSPSYSEAFPMIILEAMSAKIPVISTNVGGVTEMLKEGETGVLIPAGSIDELVSAMVDCVTDYDKYVKYADRAYVRYEKHFSLDVMARRLIEVLE